VNLRKVPDVNLRYENQGKKAGGVAEIDCGKASLFDANSGVNATRRKRSGRERSGIV